MIIKITESDLEALKKDGELVLKVEKKLENGAIMVNGEPCIPFHKAFDLHCRYNGLQFPQIGDMRKKPHWFEVKFSNNEKMRIGDKILVTRGYITNVTQGWTFDPLPNRITCGPSSGGTDWIEWGDNHGGFFDVYVKKV